MANAEDEEPHAEDEEPPSKRAKTDKIGIRRRQLETRYLGRKFYDDETKETLEIKGIEYNDADAVWTATTAGESYYLNAASKMDEMIEAQRKRERPSTEGPVEVLWTITDDDEEKEIWWRCRLGEKIGDHTFGDADGTVTVPVVEVTYDARPELGEDSEAKHKVCFVSPTMLIDVTAASEDDHMVMQWRPEGADDKPIDPNTLDDDDDDQDDNVTTLNKQNVNAMIDSALALALQGVEDKFNALARSTQCVVADKVAQAKESFKAAFYKYVEDKKQRHGPDVVLGPDDIRSIINSLKSSNVLPSAFSDDVPLPRDQSAS